MGVGPQFKAQGKFYQRNQQGGSKNQVKHLLQLELTSRDHTRALSVHEGRLSYRWEANAHKAVEHEHAERWLELSLAVAAVCALEELAMLRLH